VATDKAQNETTGLPDACKIFIDLQDEMLLQPHKDHIHHHFTKAIKSCHIVAAWIKGTWTINKTRKVGCRVANREGTVMC